MAEIQVFWTVVAGVAVYIIGQWVQRFILDPIKDFKGATAKASYLLLANQAKITNASNEEPELQTDIKGLAASLLMTAGQIPFYRLWEWPPFRLPPRPAVIEAARELNGIAHGTVRREEAGERQQYV